jgi:hypothetical protein
MGSTPPTSKFQIQTKTITSKVNNISFPVDFGNRTEDIQKAKTIFNEMNIQFDMRTILDFNVNMKLDAFTKLFSENTIRMAI